jgi:hypothetical protein
MIGLVDLVRTGAKIDVIARHLDDLDAAARVRETRMLGGREQGQLYALAADSPPLRLSDFVPDDVDDLEQVVHFGRNSQPMFKFFEKRWCRPSGDPVRLFGYNETPVRRLIGPGYFVAHATAEGGSDPRGAVVVDYFMTPDAPVVDGWPEVRPNSQGLQRFVYGQTRDYMRRVSTHVTIGEAQRKESRVMGWFVLCRQP